MNTKKIVWLSFIALFSLAASCATPGSWGTTDPPIVRVTVLNFSAVTDIGITTEINFSVANVTDEELTGLTLTVTQNPSNGVDLPFTERTIDRIAPHSTWKPDGPFIVRGNRAGSTAVFFTVTKDGKFLAKDYSLIEVTPGDLDKFPF